MATWRDGTFDVNMMSCTGIYVESTETMMGQGRKRMIWTDMVIKWQKREKIGPNQCEMVWFVMGHKVVTRKKVNCFGKMYSAPGT